MTRDDIIKLAREAGFEELFKGSGDWICTTEEIERCAALVAAHKTEVAIAEAYRCGYEAGVVAEREECAKLVEHFDGYSPRYGNHLTNCAAAIRNRREA